MSAFFFFFFFLDSFFLYRNILYIHSQNIHMKVTEIMAECAGDVLAKSEFKR
jgi:hypothetical protein